MLFPLLMSEVLRGKALALVVESATVTDESGRPVDLEELREDVAPITAETVAAEDAAAIDEANARDDEEVRRGAARRRSDRHRAGA